MSAFNKWAKGQSADDIDEDDLDEELDGDDEELDEDEEELDGPDPEAIAARLWEGELTEDEIATMDGDLLVEVVTASAEVEPELHAGVLGLADAVAAENLAEFRVAFKAMMEAEKHGGGADFDCDQCVALLEELFDRVEKGAKFDTPEGSKLLAKLIASARSGAAYEEEEEDDEELDDLDDSDDAADDAILSEFEA